MNPTTRSEMIEAHTSHTFRTLRAEQVYDAWLDPERVRKWMAHALRESGLPGDLQRVEIDPRVNGQFCFSDVRPVGEAVHWGAYLVLDRPSRIIFTWSAGLSSTKENEGDVPSRVRLTIEPNADGCTAAITHEMSVEWAEYVERTAQSWNRMLQAIEAVG